MAKILVVDDVALERANVTAIVKRMGHQVIEGADGDEALTLTNEQMPDAVVMDIVMPNKDGFAALKRINMNPKTKHIPVIIVSSKGQESDMRRGQMLGGRGWLVKPVTPQALQAALEKVL